MLRFLCAVFFAAFLYAEPNLHVFTVANSLERKTAGFLFDSAEHLGIDVHVAGFNQPYFRNGTKLLRMQEALEALPENDVVLFVDAFDVMLVQPKEEILTAFYRLKSPIVFAGEMNLFPYKKLKKAFSQNTPFPYLNSGGYIGYVSALKAFLKDLRFTEHRGDQEQIIKYHVRRKRVTIDTNAEIFLCLIRLTENDIEIHSDGTVFSNKTSTKPGVIHANGGSFPLLNKIYSTMFGAPLL